MAFIAALAAAPLSAAEPVPNVVAFNASVKVEAPQDLPQAVRSYIEKRVAGWQYEPARQDGVAVPATTFVHVGACAIPTPAGDGFNLGLDYKGNGPGVVSATGRMPPPTFPFEAQRKGLAGTFKVSYAIQPDGSTRLQEIETLAGGNKLAKLFHPVLAKWVEQMRYTPELVNGQPVATTMSFPVDFSLRDDKRHLSPELWRENYKAELQARAITSKECIAASAQTDGLQPIAQNSPVKVTPKPAG